MADTRPIHAPARPAASTTSSNPLPPAAAARFRIPQRQPNTSQSPRPPPLPRRRSSVLSFSSLDDTRRSITDEIINPRTSNRQKGPEETEVTHWHSTPLAFAILPALAGLIFQNGSAFVTDALLLGLAAIFLNWSIRLPWDWYYSAQSLRRDVEPDIDAYDPIPEALEDEIAVETASSTGGSPRLMPHNRKSPPPPDAPVQDISKREAAATDLRRQELLALLATFVFPVLAAYLLHVIRAQLSRPSTGLVSDYNLSIFLLAAEIRPFRQLVRLVANRTVHLQRTVTGIDDPFTSAINEKSVISDLTNRIIDLEAKLSEHTILPQTVSIAQKADVTDLSAEMRKRYEPRIDGLERAVRRYEKRTTAMAMATEQRLISHEARLQEALSLAAIAAQYSQHKGVVAQVLETSSKVAAFPLKIMWTILIWPFNALEELYAKLRSLLLGPNPQKIARKKHTRHESSGTDSKGKEKALRKAVR